MSVIPIPLKKWVCPIYFASWRHVQEFSLTYEAEIF